MTDKKKAPADVMAEGSVYDHETGQLTEPSRDMDPKVLRHPVDAVKDPALFEEEQVNAPVPRRADPFAHQRDAEAAEKGYKAEVKKDATNDKAADKRRDERARMDNLSAAERAKERVVLSEGKDSK